MPTYNLWPNTNGPSESAQDAQAVNLATEISITETCTATGLRFWRSNTDITGAVTGRLWHITGTGTGEAVAGSDVSFSLSGTGWQTANFTSPIPLTSGQKYKAAIHYPNFFPLTSAYWNNGAGSLGITNGPLTAPNSTNATDGQGSFSNGALTVYPGSGSVSQTNYWSDLTVTTDELEATEDPSTYITRQERAIHNIALVANTVTVISFEDDVATVEIVNMTGTAPVYITLDEETDPTVAGKNTWLLPAAICSIRLDPTRDIPTLVKLISPGTPTVSVSRV